MYNLEKDTYICDTCSFEAKWDASDDIHGELWGCEECGATFCSKCFIDQFGQDAYMKMAQESDRIYCPVCWEKHKQEL